MNNLNIEQLTEQHQREKHIEDMLSTYSKVMEINMGQYWGCLGAIKYYDLECNGNKIKVREYLDELNKLRDRKAIVEFRVWNEDCIGL